MRQQNNQSPPYGVQQLKLMCNTVAECPLQGMAKSPSLAACIWTTENYQGPKTRRVLGLGRAHLPPTKVSSDGSVNKTTARSSGAYTWDFPT